MKKFAMHQIFVVLRRRVRSIVKRVPVKIYIECETKDTRRITRTEKVQTHTVESRTIEVWASELSRYQRKRREIVFPAEIFANASDPERVPVRNIRVGLNY